MTEDVVLERKERQVMRRKRRTSQMAGARGYILILNMALRHGIHSSSGVLIAETKSELREN